MKKTEWKIHIKLIDPKPDVFMDDACLTVNNENLSRLKKEYKNRIYREVMNGRIKGNIDNQVGWRVDFDSDIPFEKLSQVDKGRVLFNTLFCFKNYGEI